MAWRENNYSTGVMYRLESGGLALKVFKWHHGHRDDWYGEAVLNRSVLFNRKYLGSGTAEEAQKVLREAVRKIFEDIIESLTHSEGTEV